jgi:pilus assembly protein TadC
MSNKSSKRDEPFDAEKEISSLKEDIKRIDALMIDQETFYLTRGEETSDKIKSFEETLDKKIVDAEKDITTFTFELISMIIGFLSIMLVIVILWINQPEINVQIEYILVALGASFVVLFGIFVASWIIKNFGSVK